MSCSVTVGIFIVIVVGINLLLYGRSRLLRRIGAIMSSITGPSIIWIAGKILSIVMVKRIWLHSSGTDDMLIIGHNITLNQLLWIPLQDAGIYILLAAVIAGLVLYGYQKISTEVDPLSFNFTFARWLDKDRKTGKRAWIVYQVMTGCAVLLALPVTGLIAYAMLQAFMIRNVTFLIKDWVDWSAFVAGAILALVYYIVNSVIALQD